MINAPAVAGVDDVSMATITIELEDTFLLLAILLPVGLELPPGSLLGRPRLASHVVVKLFEGFVRQQ